MESEMWIILNVYYLLRSSEDRIWYSYMLLLHDWINIVGNIYKKVCDL